MPHKPPPMKTFQSTPSARRATWFFAPFKIFSAISIHALREEGDTATTRTSHSTRNFNPRPPRGGRPRQNTCAGAFHHFNPRPPRGGRPELLRAKGTLGLFQSTPSARRATRIACISVLKHIFQSTPSARRATVVVNGSAPAVGISIHALREEGDRVLFPQ